MHSNIEWKKLVKDSGLKQKYICNLLDVHQSLFSNFISGEAELEQYKVSKLQQILERAIKAKEEIEQLVSHI